MYYFSVTTSTKFIFFGIIFIKVGRDDMLFDFIDKIVKVASFFCVSSELLAVICQAKSVAKVARKAW